MGPYHLSNKTFIIPKFEFTRNFEKQWKTKDQQIYTLATTPIMNILYFGLFSRPEFLLVLTDHSVRDRPTLLP